ncbi:MAG TPA: isoprenylcysteine carboxylmethyltransferase family protein [Anaerolineaceae bacterium]
MKKPQIPSGRKFSLLPRLLATLMAGSVFAFLIPFTLLTLAPRLDTACGFPSFTAGATTAIIGGIEIVIGAVYALWSISMQIAQASGTPLPFMPTQQLLVSGPYKYCRNPMAFGAISIYAGVSIYAGSISALLSTAVFTILLIIYIKQIEEKELAVRFGEAYLAYKDSTPFLVPGLWLAGPRR